MHLKVQSKSIHRSLFHSAGFTKERVRITVVGSSRMLRVAGERPIEGGNKWSRFDQTYPIPENCEVMKLQGKIEHGILTVTMPKKLISQVTPKAEVKTTQEKGPSPSKKVVAEEKSKIAKEAIPQKPTNNRVEEPIADQKSSSLPSTIKGQTDLKEQNGTQKDTPTITAATPKEQIGKAQKGQEEIEPNPTLTMDPRKQRDEKHQDGIRQKTTLETVKKQLSEKDEKESFTKKEVQEEDHWKPYESRKAQKVMDQMVIFKGKEIKARKDSPKVAETSAPKAPEKDTMGKGIRKLAASASQVVTRIGEGKLNDQDKSLVVNMGAAILVIVALGLGAYASYKFSSSGRT